MTEPNRILVIKLGALGDFILATGPFTAIRAHHRSAHITLLTTAPYQAMGRSTGWFDEVWVDQRPRWAQPLEWWRLRRRLIGGRFERVYDLQTSDRTGYYFKLFRAGRKPEWSGVAPGCSHPHANPERVFMHTLDRQAEQLAMVGIDSVPTPDLAWLDATVDRFSLAPRYALLVPGGARHRPGKRWPPGHYVRLARDLQAHGITPVLLGAAAETDLLVAIANQVDGAVNLVGQTEFGEIAALARRAVGAVGNDTGPMHIVAATGCRSVVLFSHESDPALCAPRGAEVRVHRASDIATITVDQALADIL